MAPENLENHHSDPEFVKKDDDFFNDEEIESDIPNKTLEQLVKEEDIELEEGDEQEKKYPETILVDEDEIDLDLDDED